MDATPSLTEHEAAFIRAFILAEKRDRYLTLFALPKARKKLLNRLSGGRDFDMSKASVPRTGTGFLDELRRMGAGESAFVVADASDVDGSILPLSEAVDFIAVHHFAAIASFVPGRLALVHFELSPIYLFQR